MTYISDPVQWDRTIYRGTDHAWTLRRLDGAGNPIIPSSAAAQIRTRPGGDLWVAGIITIDNTDGWVTVTIPEAATAGDPWDRRGRGVWDLEVVVSGKKYRWAQGNVTVSQDVTR